MGQGSTVARWAAGVLMLFALVVGAALRLSQLGAKPMHGDEANQAKKTGILLEKGEYHYDPLEHHGPTLYYFTLPALWLDGVKTFAASREVDYRVIPVLFGVGLIGLVWLLRRDLGKIETTTAALLTAISPAMVYYSRYYIQETLLVFFTFAAIACGWRYYRKPGVLWAIATGLSLGLMHATKETAVVAYAAMAGAFALTLLLGRRQAEASSSHTAARWKHAALAATASALVSMLFFSSFFTHPRGILDSVLTYGSYLHRAGGEGLHDKPWYYYLKLLAYTKEPFGPRWSEGLILGLAAVGAIYALTRRAPRDRGAYLLRFLTFYTCLVTLIYAFIPYKTPWCLLTFFHGMILLAGVGAVALVRWARVLPARVALVALIGLGMAQLASQAYRASYVYAADLRNPYVYAHPVGDVFRLQERAEDLAKVAPEGHRMLVRVMAPGGDYWPLPWYLRRFERVGYYSEVPPDADADLIIVSRKLQSALDLHLKREYQVEFYGLRPDVILLVYIRADLWNSYMSTR